MFPGYNRVFRSHAAHWINRGLDIPDPALGVGFASQQAPVALKPQYANLKQKDPRLTELTSLGQLQPLGQSMPVTDDMFPHLGWMGNATGGGTEWSM